MVGNAHLRDESGSSLIQTGVAIVLMVVIFLVCMSLAIAWYSVTALEAELAEAVTHANLAKVAASAEPDEALEAEILENSYALVGENLVVENVEVTPLGIEETVVPARPVEGSSATTITRERDRSRITAEVSYTVPSLIKVRWVPDIVLETRVDSEVTSETRVEVS